MHASEEELTSAPNSTRPSRPRTRAGARTGPKREGLSLLAVAITVAGLLAAFGRREPASVPRDVPMSAPGAALDSGDELPAAPEAPALSGEVREVIDVPEYTYLRLATPSGDVWAAVARAQVSTGSHVTILDAARMEHFASSTLKRTFDVIFFGRLADTDVDRALPAHHPRLAGTPSTTAAATLKVPRASGKDAFDIAELYAKRAALAGKPVTVSGQVVKVTTGVMGKNYVRLRDGSGTDPQQELVITCQFQPSLGEVVTASGTLRTDVDVGIGVVYAVLLEDATRVR